MRSSPCQEAMASLCATLAYDRALGEKSVVQLPRPGTPECDEVFLAAWSAFRHVTTQIGQKLLVEDGHSRRLDPLDAFVRGRDEVPAHLRWAETEAMIRAGEWSGHAPLPRTRSRGAGR